MNESRMSNMAAAGRENDIIPLFIKECQHRNTEMWPTIAIILGQMWHKCGGVTTNYFSIGLKVYTMR